jgi:hypothetical protein
MTGFKAAVTNIPDWASFSTQKGIYMDFQGVWREISAWHIIGILSAITTIKNLFNFCQLCLDGQ